MKGIWEMNNQAEKSPGQPDWDGESNENIGLELWRLWVKDIKPHFEAERKFLEKYGLAEGYNRAYISRVLGDHQLLENLVWSREEQAVREFAKALNAHVRFKQDFFAQKIRGIVERDI